MKTRILFSLLVLAMLAAHGAGIKAGTNANLSSITLNPASLLTQTGSSATLVTYTTSVDPSATSVTQSAVTADPGATMTVNGAPVASGTASGSITLNASGTTTITTIVTATGGNTRTYKIVISKNGSTIATLQSISISPAAALIGNGTVGTTTTYTTSVDPSVTSVTETAVTNDATATITVNGSAVASGTPSGSIALNATGTTTITTVVTAAAGTTRTYKIIISKNGSNIATLKGLSISPAALLTNTGTSGSVTTYTTSVDAAVTSVTQTATTNDANATMTVNGTLVASGVASGGIALNASGTTTITTVVTAPAGNTRTYKIIISKNGSSIATLKSIKIAPAALLTFAGSAGTITTYTTSVDPSVTSIKQTAVIADASATMTVNGVPVASATASGNIALNASGTTTVTTVVTAAAGNTHTYQIIISKNGSSIATLKSISLTPASVLTNAGTAGTTTTYTTLVSILLTSVTQTAVTSDTKATMTVNGVPVASGAASGSIALNPTGTTTITTVVTAPAGNTHTYQIIISYNTPIATTWTGAAGTLWSNAANWTSGVPAPTTDVTIPATANHPVLDVSSKCNSLTIDGNTTVTINNPLTITGVLNVHQPYTLILAGNNTTDVGGLLTIGVSATVNVSGTSVLTLDNSLIFSNNATLVNNSKVITKANCVITFNGGTNPCKLINNGVFTATTTYFELTDGTSITNTGTLTANAASEFTLGDKNSSIINSGTFNAGSPGSKCSIMITGLNSSINNSGNFILGDASVIYPSGVGAKITNTNTFTLKSGNSSSAAIGPLGSGAACVGNFSVERYISGGTGFRGYRLASSPVYGNTVGTTNVYSINYLQHSAYITGTTGTTGGFDKAGNPTLYLYRENMPSSNASFTSGNFRGINTIGTGTNYSYLIDGDGPTPFSIPAGAGFLFFFRGDRAADVLANETVPTYVSTPATLTTTGILNQGNVDVKEWYGASDLKATNTGYTLVGNPYASSINLDTYNGANGTTGIIGTGLFPNIYVLNPITKNYGIYNPTNPSFAINGASNIIVSGQGFFVQADPSAGAASLRFTEAAKIPDVQATPGPNGNFLMGMPAGPYDVRQILRIKLVIDSFNYDDIAIAFNSHSSSKYNRQEDSEYLAGMSAAEGLASFSTDNVPVALSINFLPLPKKTRQVI
ncbi:MAG: cadherin-like beta sandwich domain-containing protein, partial [Mucilaginibacter sp.]